MILIGNQSRRLDYFPDVELSEVKKGRVHRRDGLFLS
jgi:hypothetical protein